MLSCWSICASYVESRPQRRLRFLHAVPRSDPTTPARNAATLLGSIGKIALLTTGSWESTATLEDPPFGTPAKQILFASIPTAAYSILVRIVAGRMVAGQACSPSRKRDYICLCRTRPCHQHPNWLLRQYRAAHIFFSLSPIVPSESQHPRKQLFYTVGTTNIEPIVYQQSQQLLKELR